MWIICLRLLGEMELVLMNNAKITKWINDDTFADHTLSTPGPVVKFQPRITPL
jgi:hypothetical protein